VEKSKTKDDMATQRLTVDRNGHRKDSEREQRKKGLNKLIIHGVVVPRVEYDCRQEKKIFKSGVHTHNQFLSDRWR